MDILSIENLVLAKEALLVSSMVYMVTQSLKKAGVPGRFLPLVSIGAGVAISFLLGFGLLFGLGGAFIASGIYSQVKASAKTPEEDQVKEEPDFV